MTGRGKKAVVPRKKANGYKMPAPIATGEVIHDTTMKKKWRFGPSIGVGGFGEIYSACDHESTPKGSNYPFVVKIEPHENGPLFVEKHFYVRNAKMDDIKSYMKSKKLSSLGMPTYFGNGSHEYKGEKYRYLVLERYGTDLWTLFKDSGRAFPPATVFQIGLQMLDVLEYIHSRGYVHADIKGANILMGLKKGTENQAYLVDFGMATRVNDKEFKPDPKCAHNGTIEYTSRDAHLGVMTMRGDLEILGYNLLQWLAGKLPWEKSLNQPKAVQDMKETFMKSVKSSVTKNCPGAPEALIKFFDYINSLKPKEVPDYTKCRQIFETYLKSQGVTRSSKLVFTPPKKTTKKATLIADDDDSNASDEEVPKKRLPKANGNASKPVKRGRKPKVQVESASEDEQATLDDDSNASDEEIPKKKLTKANGNASKPVKKGRKPKVESESEDDENEEPEVKVTKVKRKPKRQSLEPSVVVKVKRTKLAPKATPPVKENHANAETQTSTSKTRQSPRRVSPRACPRQVSSPVCEVISDKKPQNSSADMFDDDDSFVLEDIKIKRKKKLLSDEEYMEKREVRRKVTSTIAKPKAKSWKDCASIMNGRSPPK